MNLRRLLVVALFGFLAAGSSPAQDAAPAPTPSPLPSRRPLWVADMPAGEYCVRLASITSVSMHQYVLDTTVRVTEVTIATTGSEIARFYYLEPNTPQLPLGQSAINSLQDKLEQTADHVANDDWRKVVKNYPVSTHAHTIEYRLGSRASLDKLYDSIKQSWVRDEGAIFKP